MKPHSNSPRNMQFTWKRRKILSRPTSTDLLPVVITVLQLHLGIFGAAAKSSLTIIITACERARTLKITLARLSGAIMAIIAPDIVARACNHIAIIVPGDAKVHLSDR